MTFLIGGEVRVKSSPFSHQGGWVHQGGLMSGVDEDRRDWAEIGIENISRICIHLNLDEIDEAHFLELSRIADRPDEDDPNRFPLSAVPDIEALNRGVMQTLEALARKRGLRFFYDDEDFYAGYVDGLGYSWVYGGRT